MPERRCVSSAASAREAGPERRADHPAAQLPAGGEEDRQREHDHGGAGDERQPRSGIGRGVEKTPAI